MKFKHWMLPIITSLYGCVCIASAQEVALDYYINQGIANSPLIKEYSNQINANIIDSLLIKTSRKLQINYNTGLYYAPIINGIGYSEPLTNISYITSVISVSQKISDSRVNQSEYTKLTIQNQSLQASSKISEKDLKKAITLQYLTLCSLMNDINFTGQLLASSKEEETIIKILVEKGLYKQVDYYSFMVELQAQELILNELQIQYRKELSTLNIMCGIPDTSLIKVVMPEILPTNSIITNSSNYNSPFFQRFVLDSLRIQNEKVLADQNYKPSLSWFVDAGLYNNKPEEISKNFGFSMGLSLSIPIFDGKQRKYNSKKILLEENTRSNYSKSFNLQYNQQIQQIYNELKMTQDLMHLIKNQLEFAELLSRQNTILLNKGNISITDYITAQRNYIAVKQKYNQYQIRILQIITEINYWNQ
jgi:outer membrane protein TolC